MARSLEAAPAANTAHSPYSGYLGVLDCIGDVVVAAALIGELLVIIGNVVGRTLFDVPVLWSDEMATLALSTIAFVGGAIAYRRDAHVSVRTLVDGMPARLRPAIIAASDWLVLEIAVTSAWYSLGLLAARRNELTPTLEMSGTWFALPLTVGMA